MEPPTLLTRRLTVRALAVEDSEAVYGYRSLPAVYRYQGWAPRSAAEVAEFLERMHAAGFGVVDTWYQFGLFTSERARLVGDIGLHFLPPDNEQVEIGFTVAPEHQRRGYASEAVTAMIGCVFGRLRKHRLVASVDPGNTASVSLLEKIGMRREAHFRKSAKIRGAWEDDLVYAMLCEEWLTMQPGCREDGMERGRAP